jgi:ZIP family zinc transporter
MPDVLLFAFVPTLAMIGAAVVTLRYPPGPGLLGACQHLAAGVVTAAVAVELLPAMLDAGSLIAATFGYLLGLAAVLLLRRFAARAGTVAPIAIDLFVDGLLLAIGFAAGQLGGMILLLGLTLETISLGLVTAPSLARSGMAPHRILGIVIALGAAILIGALAGSVLPTGSTAVLSLVLGFGISALLYLVVEELLSEAHEVEDTGLATAMFFLGFLVPLILGHAA